MLPEGKTEYDVTAGAPVGYDHCRITDCPDASDFVNVGCPIVVMFEIEVFVDRVPVLVTVNP